jgi:hypothetical protein
VLIVNLTTIEDQFGDGKSCTQKDRKMMLPSSLGSEGDGDFNFHQNLTFGAMSGRPALCGDLLGDVCDHPM